MVLAAPHYEAAAEAHDPLLDVDHPGFAPRLIEPVPRPPAKELLDVGTEEPPRVPPGVSAERVSGRGHQGARVELPARPPQGICRDVEVEGAPGLRRRSASDRL